MQSQQYFYDRARHRKNRKAASRARVKARCAPMPTKAKPGVRPLSTFHPDHPARRFGWDDQRTVERNTRIWA